MGFHFEAPTSHMGYLVIPGAIVDLGRPNINMDDNRGVLSWVRAYRGMVHDWCAAHRASRLAAEEAGNV
jgi:hypothetical protein